MQQVDPGEVPVAALHDVTSKFVDEFITMGEAMCDSISLWRIEDDHSNLKRVIAGMAAARDTLGNFEYILFNEVDLALVAELSLSEGTSKDININKISHYDGLIKSGDKLINLLRNYLDDKAHRVLKSEIKPIIAESIGNKFINKNELNPTLQAHF